MRHYRFVDWATQGYLLAVAGLIAVCHGGKISGWHWFLLAHALAMGLIHGVVRAYEGGYRPGWMAFLRYMYPVILYTGFYRETGLINQMFVTGFLDAWVIRVDQAMFGFQPCLLWMEKWPQLWISELFYIAYFSYYVMIAGVGIALFVRDRRQCHHYVAVVSFVFYLCYLVYIVFPVVGPRLFFREINGYRLPADLLAMVNVPEYPDTVQQGPFFHIMKFIYRYFEAEGAAFPSSHVAIALCTLLFSWRYLPRIRWGHAVMVLLLCMSTVYCRYHYVLDVLLGIATALILAPLGDWLYRRLEGERLGPEETVQAQP